MEYKIREACVEDIDSICGLLFQLFEQEVEFIPNLQLQKRGVREIVSNPQLGKILVIESEHTVIGSVSLLFTISTALGGKVAILEDLIIDKAFRGNGLGKDLLAAAMKAAKSQDCLRITLLTDAVNKAAQALYKQFGFECSTMQPMRLNF